MDGCVKKRGRRPIIQPARFTDNFEEIYYSYNSKTPIKSAIQSVLKNEAKESLMKHFDGKKWILIHFLR
jgi:hypothetical protein